MERRTLTLEDLTSSLIGAVVTNDSQTYGNAIVIQSDPVTGSVQMATAVYGLQELPYQMVTFIARNMQEHMAASLDRTQQTLLDFKREVAQKAMAAAREHDWCSEVRDVLKDLDVPLPNEHFDARVTVTFDLTFLRLGDAAWDKTDLDNPNLDWVHQSFSVTDQGTEPMFEGDSDLELKEVRYVEREVLELRESSWED